MCKIDFGKANKYGAEDMWEKKQAKIDIINFKSFIDFFYLRVE